MPNCLLCEAENQFYDPSILIDEKLNDELFAAIIGLETDDMSNINQM